MRAPYPHIQRQLDTFERTGRQRDALWLPCKDELSASQIVSVFGDTRIIGRDEANDALEEIIEQWTTIGEYAPEHVGDYSPTALRQLVLHIAEESCLFYDEVQCMYRLRDTMVDTAWEEYVELFEDELREIGCTHGDLRALTDDGTIGILIHPVRISSRFVCVYTRTRCVISFLGDHLTVEL